MSARHAWAPVKTTARWRVLEQCTKCEAKRWAIADRRIAVGLAP